MMNNKLRIEKKNIYTIEVNDNGDTIEFDLEDIELPLKLNEAFMSVDRITNSLKQKEIAISKKEVIKKGIMTNVEEERIKAYRDAFKEMRKAMDCFLGKGACQKIFGNRNYPDMYDDLFEQLQPHLEKMKIKSENIAKKIEEKYSNSDKKVLK